MLHIKTWHNNFMTWHFKNIVGPTINYGLNRSVFPGGSNGDNVQNNVHILISSLAEFILKYFKHLPACLGNIKLGPTDNAEVQNPKFEFFISSVEILKYLKS